MTATHNHMKRIVLILLLFVSTLSRGTKIYMNAAGSDAAAGTSPATAWQTLSKLNSQFLTSSDTVFFNRGDAFFGRLNLTRSGTAGSPVVYTTYGTGADPIITGYITLSTWTNNGGNVYASAAPGIKGYAHNLIMDGAFQYIAQNPNTGFIAFTPVSTTSITTSESSPPNHIGDSVVVKSSRYTLDHALITGQTGSTYTISAVTYSGVGGVGFKYYNSSKWMDVLGEWVVNTTQDSVYVYFPSGPSGHTVQVSTVDTLVYASGSYIHVINLHFTGGNMYNLLNPFGSGNVVLDSCLIDYAYTGCDLRAQRDTIRNSMVYNCLNNGVMAPTNNITKYSALVNNQFKNIGLLAGMGKTGTGNYEGINLPADDFYCYLNDMDSVGYNGLFTSFDSVYVVKNKINHHCLTLSDGGGIYIWEQNTTAFTHPRVVDSNLVMNGYGNNDGATITVGTMANGIYTDGKSNLVVITNNTLIGNSGPGLYNHGTNMTYKYNRVYDNGLAAMLQSEFSGQPITGIVAKYNQLVSPDTSKAVIFFFSPSNDLASFASDIDSNYYGTTNAVVPFKTQANGGAVVSQTLSALRTLLSIDAHSTYLTGTLSNNVNTGQTYTNRFLSGKYKGLDGVVYNQLLQLEGYSSLPTFLLDVGTVTTTTGVRFIVH